MKNRDREVLAEQGSFGRPGVSECGVVAWGRSLAGVARILGCDRHTLSGTVVSAGTTRIAVTTASGLDETLLVR